MFLRYFLVRFYGFFGCYLGLFCILFSATNLFMRSATLPSAAAIPALFITMIPLMVIFSLPISSIMAVRTTLGSLMVRDELLFIFFSQRAQRHLLWAVAIFSLSVTFFFAPFVAIWAPQAYLKGKNLIIELAKNQLNELTPGMLHAPLPGLSFSYAHRGVCDHNPGFNKLFLAFNNGHNHFIFTAEHGFLKNDMLILKNGSMNIVHGSAYHHAQFNECELSMYDLLDGNHEQTAPLQMKFLTVHQLFKLSPSNAHALIELLKRFSQLIWQFVFPLIAFFWMFIFPRPRGYLVRSLLFSGMLFLIMHLSCAIAHACSNSLSSVFMFLFVLPIGLLFGLFWRFLNIW